ncbi:hypothetical protein RSAG8_07542, partial [Rhizoctonia solani AG-8 WAC10335]
MLKSPETGCMQRESNFIRTRRLKKYANLDQAPLIISGYEELPPTDTDDAELILSLFVEYLDKEKREVGPPPGDMMGFPFAMVYRTTLKTLPDRAPSFLAAVTERFWKMLASAAPTLTLCERIVDSYEYG